jgi:hypothetical protein
VVALAVAENVKPSRCGVAAYTHVASVCRADFAFIERDNEKRHYGREGRAIADVTEWLERPDQRPDRRLFLERDTKSFVHRKAEKGKAEIAFPAYC